MCIKEVEGDDLTETFNNSEEEKSGLNLLRLWLFEESDILKNLEDKVATKNCQVK